MGRGEDPLFRPNGPSPSGEPIEAGTRSLQRFAVAHEACRPMVRLSQRHEFVEPLFRVSAWREVAVADCRRNQLLADLAKFPKRTFQPLSHGAVGVIKLVSRGKKGTLTR